MTADRTLSTPLHVRAERALRALVADTEPGSLLPPETSIAADLGVSRTTIRQAMQRLVDAGIVVRTPGRGTEVVDRHIDTQLDFTPFARAFEASGHEVRTAEAAIVRRRADNDEAVTLELEDGAPVHELRRLRLVDDIPFALLISVLPASVPLPDDLTGSLYEHLETASVQLARLSDTVSAVGATSEVAAALGTRRGAPALLIRRVARDDTGRPVELTHTYLRSGAGYTVEHKR